MEGELGKFSQVLATSALSGCYCYAISKSTNKGFLRLLLILPVIIFFASAPYSVLKYRNLSIIIWGSLTWLGISKLLLLAFSTGPLAAPDQSLSRFVCTLMLPIKSGGSSPGSDPVKSKAGGLWMWAVLGAKAVGFGCFIIAFNNYGEGMPYWAMIGVLGCYIYLALELLLGITGALARALLGLELAPQAEKPYLSTSLQDFWGKRWNLMISDILRQTVHNPTRKLAMPFIGKKAAILVGVFATFLVSGLMHEWLYTILIRTPPSWEITWFFVLHGACLVIELMIKEAIGSKWKLHRLVSGMLTLGFVMVTLAWLHFPPVLRSNTHEKFMEAAQKRKIYGGICYVWKLCEEECYAVIRAPTPTTIIPKA